MTTATSPTPEQAPERLSLRKLIELVGPEFMDAELCVQMSDGHRNHQFAFLPTDLYRMPRRLARPGVNEASRITFTVYTTDKSFVKDKKS